jgi:kumamolisin
VRQLGLTDARVEINFSLVLRLPGGRRLQRFLEGLSNPRSRDYRHFISPSRFGERFGVSRVALLRVSQRLSRDGVTVIRGYPQRTALEVRARARVVDHEFGVRLVDYLDSRGRRYHRLQGNAKVPAAMRATVSGVSGLDTEPDHRPADVPPDGLTPRAAALAYSLVPLTNMGIRGQGQKIALVSLASANPADLATFKARFGIAGPPPRVIPVAGGAGPPGSGQSEVNLDLDVLSSTAPQAQILNYTAPNGPVTFGQIYDRIVADRQANIVSQSWGSCESDPLTTAEFQRDEHSIAAAIAAGVTIFDATGDAGAYDCSGKGSGPGALQLAVEYPASSPGVVAVGGTSLSVAQDGSYFTETAWEGVLERTGGGGGLSTLFARPSWQAGPGVLNPYSNGRRQLPDVSAAADVASSWPAYSQGSLSQAFGTSAATPFWAASMLLIGQYAQQQGVGRLGFVDPMLYAIASSTQPLPAFHDVTRGGNLLYQATRGWDYATGLGSPDVFNLARDVVAYLRQHPGH